MMNGILLALFTISVTSVNSQRTCDDSNLETIANICKQDVNNLINKNEHCSYGNTIAALNNCQDGCGWDLFGNPVFDEIFDNLDVARAKCTEALPRDCSLTAAFSCGLQIPTFFEAVNVNVNDPQAVCKYVQKYALSADLCQSFITNCVIYFDPQNSPVVYEIQTASSYILRLAGYGCGCTADATIILKEFGAIQPPTFEKCVASDVQTQLSKLLTRSRICTEKLVSPYPKFPLDLDYKEIVINYMTLNLNDLVTTCNLKFVESGATVYRVSHGFFFLMLWVQVAMGTYMLVVDKYAGAADTCQQLLNGCVGMIGDSIKTIVAQISNALTYILSASSKSCICLSDLSTTVAAMSKIPPQSNKNSQQCRTAQTELSRLLTEGRKCTAAIDNPYKATIPQLTIDFKETITLAYLTSLSDLVQRCELKFVESKASVIVLGLGTLLAILVCHLL